MRRCEALGHLSSWRSWIAHHLAEVGVAGSNPAEDAVIEADTDVAALGCGPSGLRTMRVRIPSITPWWLWRSW